MATWKQTKKCTFEVDEESLSYEKILKLTCYMLHVTCYMYAGTVICDINKGLSLSPEERFSELK